MATEFYTRAGVDEKLKAVAGTTVLLLDNGAEVPEDAPDGALIVRKM